MGCFSWPDEGGSGHVLLEVGLSSEVVTCRWLRLEIVKRKGLSSERDLFSVQGIWYRSRLSQKVKLCEEDDTTQASNCSGTCRGVGSRWAGKRPLGRTVSGGRRSHRNRVFARNALLGLSLRRRRRNGARGSGTERPVQRLLSLWALRRHSHWDRRSRKTAKPDSSGLQIFSEGACGCGLGLLFLSSRLCHTATRA